MSDEVPIEEGLLEVLGPSIDEELDNAGFLGNPQPIQPIEDDSGGPGSSPKYYAELQPAILEADVEDPPATSEPEDNVQYEDLEKELYDLGAAGKLAEGSYYEEPSEEQTQENSSDTIVETNRYVYIPKGILIKIQ